MYFPVETTQLAKVHPVHPTRVFWTRGNRLACETTVYTVGCDGYDLQR